MQTREQTGKAPKVEIHSNCCRNCVWGRPNPQQTGHNECRRYPPVPAHFQGKNMAGQSIWGTYTGFPVVQDACWCGEWQGASEPIDGYTVVKTEDR